MSFGPKGRGRNASFCVYLHMLDAAFGVHVSTRILVISILKQGLQLVQEMCLPEHFPKLGKEKGAELKIQESRHICRALLPFDFTSVFSL